jgi:ABC-type multidrug transport system permease subunit
VSKASADREARSDAESTTRLEGGRSNGNGNGSGSGSVAVTDWPILVLVQTRLVEFTRKPAAVFWTYVFPLVMMFILGSAFRSQTEPRVEIGVVVTGDPPAWVEGIPADSGLLPRVVSEAEGLNLLRAGRIALLVRPASPAAGGGGPGGDADSVVSGYQLLYDPTRSGGQVAELLLREQFRRANGPVDPLPLTVTPYSEPGARYIDFLVPGLIGMTLLGGGLWGVGYAIVDMRIRKLLKRYLATPMRRSDFLLAIVFSRLLFMFPQVAIILLASYLAFSVQIHGPWFDVFLLVLLGGLQFAGVGLLIACRAKTMETMSGLINLAMLPMWTLSGIFFSYQNFPEILHWPIRLLPLTPLLDALRGVMLEGQSCWMFPIEMSLILAWTGGTFAIALWLFRWND